MEMAAVASSSRSMDSLLEAGRTMEEVGGFLRRSTARSGFSSDASQKSASGGQTEQSSLAALRRENQALKRALLQLHPHLSFDQ